MKLANTLIVSATLASSFAAFSETYTCSSTVAFVPDADFGDFTGSFTVNVSSLSKTGGSLYCNTSGYATDFSGSAWSIYRAGTIPGSTGTSGTGSLCPWRFKGETIQYGQLSMNIPEVGYMGANYPTNTLEIGYLDKDSYLGGKWYAGCTYPIVWLAPAATLTNTATNTYAIVVKGGGELSFGGVTSGIPTERITVAEKGGYLRYEPANYAAVTNRLVVAGAPLGLDVPAGETCVFEPALLTTGSRISCLLKKGDGVLSVPLNTLFTNALPRAQQRKVAIIVR